MTSLEGKVVAITGAASGIGLATAHLLASRGASISVADVRQKPLDAAVAAIKDSSLNVKIFAKGVDVLNGQAVDDWLDETIKELGPLTGAVNLAGVISKGSQIVDTTDKDWDFTMNVNVKGKFHCIRAELQRMDKDASIVTASSVAGLHGYPSMASYSTSKHAIIGLTRSAAKEAGAKSIRVNCIAPGPTDTPMLAQLAAQSESPDVYVYFGAVPPHSSSADAAMLSIKRNATADEVARLIAFLLSDESSFTTGACYTIDGEWTA